MKPSVSGGHSAYQDLVLDQLRKYYPSAADSLPASTWEIMERFWNLDLSHSAYTVSHVKIRTVICGIQDSGSNTMGFSAQTESSLCDSERISGRRYSRHRYFL